MRLFIAINISKRCKKLITKKIKLFKKEINENIKWVKNDNWHITIKFLGEVKKRNLPEIKKEIKYVKDMKKFYFQINHLGAFPNLDYPKIIYFGINKGENNLINIHKQIEDKLAALNYKKDERKFTPHLTIARGRKNTNYQKLSHLLRDFIKNKNNFINIYSYVDRISLMQSTLTPEGPIYQEIFSKKLY